MNEKKYSEAAAKFEETIPYLRADEDKEGEANVLNNVGVTYALGGDHTKAGGVLRKIPDARGSR